MDTRSLPYAAGIGGYDLSTATDQVIAFDYYSSGKADHLICYRPGSGTVWILEHGSGNSFYPVFAGGGIGGYNLSSPSDQIIAFDYDGSGKRDHLLCYRPGTGLVSILAHGSGNSFTAVYASSSGIGGYDLSSPADRIIAFDYDGSGKMDHLVVYRPGAGVVWILSHGSGNSFVAQFASGSGIGGFDLSSTADNIIAFDYDGTGLMDHLVLYRPGGGAVWILEHGSGNSFDAVAAGTGIGGFDLSSPADHLIAYDYSQAGLSNYLLAYRPCTGVVWILAHGSGNSFSPQFASSSGIGGFDLSSTVDQMISFDYTSNGTQPNLLAYRPGSGEAYVVQQSSYYFSAVYEAPNLPTLTLTNLTNPGWGSNFAVGDTFQVTISSGMPYQQVAVAGSSSGNLLVGQTDGNGSFTYTEVENSSQIGSYTEVWTVGQYTASPSISFLVGQLGNPGTISTTAMGQTSDSDITGISTLSITNGVVSTYSATELDDTASLYYDSQTVATLFDQGTQVAQTSAYAYGGSASANLTANTTDWDIYDLQTDHYAVAYFVSGGYYENPFDYDGEGECFDDTGDCTFGSGGGDDYYVTVATIYLGSTLAEMLGEPTAGSFVLQKDPTGLPGAVQSKVDAWTPAVVAAALAVKIFIKNNGHPPSVPAYLVTVGDCQTHAGGTGLPDRIRSYRIFDQYDQPFAGSSPVRVRENVLTYSGPAISADGNWGRNPRADEPIDPNGNFDDELAFRNPTSSLQSRAIQQFWASNFSIPTGLTLPSLSGYAPGTLPLAIVDQLSTISKGIWTQLNNVYDPHFIGINGDNGAAPNKNAAGAACGN